MLRHGEDCFGSWSYRKGKYTINSHSRNRLHSFRAHAVRRHQPITLPITISTPCLEEDDDQGLYHLASIFRPLDESFFAVWNGSKHNCTKEWLLELEQDVRCALPPVLNLSDEVTANVRVSQLWLRIKLWELFPRFGYLSAESLYDCLMFKYPILVAKDLWTLATNLPIQSFRVHGVGMVCYTNISLASLLTTQD